MLTDLKSKTIYVSGHGQLPVKEALRKLNDDFIKDGNFNSKTVLDLRDLNLYLLNEFSLCIWGPL